MVVATAGLSFLLVASVIAAIAAPSFAFTNGQSASLVIGQTGFTGGGSSTTATGLWGGRDVAFDSSGNLWVADSSNNRVLDYLKAAGFTTGQSASVTIGQSDYTHANSGNTANGLSIPGGLAFDRSGNLWVADSANNRVLEFATPLTSAESASLVIGQVDFVHNTPGTTAVGLASPQGLAFDSSGNLWVADQSNNRVLKYASPFSTGQSASIVVGQSDFAHSTGGTTASGLQNPTGLAFDSAGDLWVADQYNNRVLEYTPPFSTGQSASLVLGQNGFTSVSGGTSAFSLHNPARLAFDSSGRLWLADSANNRVLEFTAPFTTGESASLVIGQPDFTGQAAATTASGLQNPAGLAFDSSGNLWAADSGNNRVLEHLGLTQTTTTVTTTSTTVTTVTTTITATTSTTSTATISSTYSTTSTVTYTTTTAATSTAIVTSSQTLTTTTTSVATSTQTVRATETTTQTLTSTYTVSTTASSASGSATTIAGGSAAQSPGLNSPTLIAVLAVAAVLVLLVLLAIVRRARLHRGPLLSRPSSWS